MLRVLAGKTALEMIRSNGLVYDQIQTLAGASGGAKWLVLSQMDRVIAEEILPRLTAPTHLLGSSIGAWRMSAFCKRDPANAIAELERAYVHQRYDAKPSPAEVSETSLRLAADLIGDEAEGICDHPTLRLSIVAARSRGLAASKGRIPQLLALSIAAAGNFASRRAIGWAFERVLFSDPRDPPPFQLTPAIRDHSIPLRPDNLVPAVLASGSIPLVLDGVTDIPGAPPGVYRDGGVTDYHFADRLSDHKSLTLLPHFYPHLIPGWFDKGIKSRRRGSATLDNTIVLCPSDEFVRALPHSRIPTRHDFLEFEHNERLKIWNEVLDRCRQLADELRQIIADDRWAERAQPLYAW